MLKVDLIRTESGRQGTFGILIVKDKHFFTVEPEWCNNERNISCIPFGVYQCEISHSPRFGKVYQVKKVKGRTDILIHPGNWGGNERQGLKTNTDGCILLGEKIANIYDQRAVVNSKKTLIKFMQLMEDEPFELTISGMDIW